MTDIFLIEDNPADVLLIEQILKDVTPAVTLRVALDGEQALQMLGKPKFKPDLIILDLNILGVPGLVLLKQCKRLAPVAVFTSSRDPADLRKAFDLGVREFIEKPCDFEGYADAVRAIVQNGVAQKVGQ